MPETRRHHEMPDKLNSVSLVRLGASGKLYVEDLSVREGILYRSVQYLHTSEREDRG